MSRTISAALASALAAFVLSGCYGVTEEHAAQEDVIGDTVRVVATLSPLDALAGRLPGQFLAAFLVSQGTALPAAVDARLPGSAVPTAMTRRPSLDETLQDTRPAPPGRRWAGYVSPVVGLPAGVATAQDVDALVRQAGVAAPPAPPDADWSVQGDFGIGRGDGGLPLPAAFDHAVMGGFRVAFPSVLLDAAPGAPDDVRAFALGLLDRRPIDCREVRTFPFPTLFGEVRSGGATIPALPTTACGPSSAGGSLALADLRGAGASVTAAPGETVALGFTLRSVGPAGPVYTLSASTSLAGAAAMPSAATLEPSGPGFHDLTVAVAVPAGARPGDYDVSLVARVGAQRREAVGRITVAAQLGAAGEPELAGILGITIRQQDERHLRFSAFPSAAPGPLGTVALGNVWCLKERAACDVRVRLSAGRAVLGLARLRVPAQTRRRVGVRVGRRTRALLAHGRTVDAVVTVRRAADPEPLVDHIALRGRATT